jgi:hypothetical protein
MKRKSSASVIKDAHLGVAVRKLVKAWPERMDYGQLDDRCKLLGCELFSGLVKTWREVDEDKAIHFFLLANQAAQLAKDYVKKRGLIFIGEGESNYWNATKVSPAVVARWHKEKADRLKAEREKAEAETESWWTTLAPKLKEALLSSNRNAPQATLGRFESM